MALDRDTVLLETVKTHRSRLQSAFLYGELAERRPAVDNVKRVIASAVLAAVVSVGCIGFAMVTGFLATQAADQRRQLLPAVSTSSPSTTGPSTTGPSNGADRPPTAGASR